MMQRNSRSTRRARKSWNASRQWESANQWSLSVALLSVTIASGCNPPQSSTHTRSAEVSDVEQAKPPVLITVSISPESRVKAAAEDLAMELHQGIWQDFVIEIENAAGITAPLVIESEQFLQSDDDSSRDRWLQLELKPNGALTGMRNEIRTLSIKSRDSGIRTAILNFNAGQGTQDLGFRSDVLVTFKVHEK
jgi:hypothetical protein